MLTGRHKQINHLKQGNAFNGEQASINQETGRILETCAQIQKQLGELNRTNKPERHRWTHTGGEGGRGVMRDRWNTSGRVTQETHTGWKWSHSDQSRGECLRTTGSDYACVTWREDKHALGTGARHDTMQDHLWCSRNLTLTHKLHPNSLLKKRKFQHRLFYLPPPWKKKWFPSSLSSFSCNVLLALFLFWGLIHHIIPCKYVHLC